MKTTNLVSLTTLLALTLPAAAWAQQSDVPDIPDTPAAIDALVYARPFALEKSYKSAWRQERPLVKEGYLLVLKVDRDLVYPRQTAEPVLYAGDQTVERINVGYESGHVVAIVPGKLDLTKTPIWFGTPELPERCNAKTIREEKRLAEQAGIKPPTREQVTAAQKKGGERLKTADRYELRRAAADLIAQYAPDEAELVESLLMPRDE